MLSIEQAQRIVRYVHLAMLFSIIVFYILLEYLIRPTLKPDNRNIYIVLIVICIVILNSLVYFRQKYIAASVEMLRSNPNDQVALKRWQAGHLITFASCEAVALCGFNARILGAPKLMGFALFAVGLYTLVAYRPKPILE